MKGKIKIYFALSAAFIVAFVLWTLLVSWVNIKPIGPNGSNVGFAKLNGFVHEALGVHMTLYVITDWLGLVPVGVGFVFGILGLVQWIKRKKFSKVDFDILALGGFYIVVALVYILFEIVTINNRPVLINGYLETSYPSSTTMLVMCVMPTLIMQLNNRIKSKALKIVLDVLISFFITFMVIGRLISGVHWLSDIIGGILISTGLVLLYYATVKILMKKKQ